MAYCSILHCTNRFYSKERIFKETGKNITFHYIPKEKGLRKKWLVAIRHVKVLKSKRAYVCSDHFKEDEIKKTLAGKFVLKPGVVPSKFCCMNTEKLARKPPKSRVLTKPQQDTEIYNDQEITPLDHPASDDITSSSSLEANFHDYFVPKQSEKDMLEAARKEMGELQKCLEGRNKKIVELEWIGLERYSKDPDMIKFYTGFSSYTALTSFFNAISPHAADVIKWTHVVEGHKGGVKETESSNNNNVSLIDQFFCFLHKIRLGSFDEDIADRFNISPLTISRNTISWVNFLYCLLGPQPLWPTKEQVQRDMPSAFYYMYPNVRVILHCREICVQSQSSLFNNSIFCPNDIPDTIYKGLVGITPSGSVSFISTLYSDSISNKLMTRKSGVLDLLDAGDEVMANNCFKIEDLLNEKGCRLVPLRTLQKKGHISGKKNNKEKIANLGEHVEKAVKRIEEYQIFDKIMSPNLAGRINQLWKVCCYLSNVQSPLTEQK